MSERRKRDVELLRVVSDRHHRKLRSAHRKELQEVLHVVACCVAYCCMLLRVVACYCMLLHVVACC